MMFPTFCRQTALVVVLLAVILPTVTSDLCAVTSTESAASPIITGAEVQVITLPDLSEIITLPDLSQIYTAAQEAIAELWKIFTEIFDWMSLFDPGMVEEDKNDDEPVPDDDIETHPDTDTEVVLKLSVFDTENVDENKDDDDDAIDDDDVIGNDDFEDGDAIDDEEVLDDDVMDGDIMDDDDDDVMGDDDDLNGDDVMDDDDDVMDDDVMDNDKFDADDDGDDFSDDDVMDDDVMDGDDVMKDAYDVMDDYYLEEGEIIYDDAQEYFPREEYSYDPRIFRGFRTVEFATADQNRTANSSVGCDEGEVGAKAQGQDRPNRHYLESPSPVGHRTPAAVPGAADTFQEVDNVLQDSAHTGCKDGQCLNASQSHTNTEKGDNPRIRLPGLHLPKILVSGIFQSINRLIHRVHIPEITSGFIIEIGTCCWFVATFLLVIYSTFEFKSDVKSSERSGGSDVKNAHGGRDIKNTAGIRRFRHKNRRREKRT